MPTITVAMPRTRGMWNTAVIRTPAIMNATPRHMMNKDATRV